MSAKPADRRTLLILTAVLAVLVLGCLVSIAWRRSTLGALSHVQGRVVEIEVRSGSTPGRSNTQRVPVAELRLPGGEVVRAPLESSSNSPFCCSVGEEVEVLYEPSDPKHTARANLVGDLYGPQAAFAAVGALFLLILTRALRRASPP